MLHDASQRDYSAEEPLAEPPVEGGPKTTEMPAEFTVFKQVLEEISVSPNPSCDLAFGS